MKLFDSIKEKAKRIVIDKYLVEAGISPEFMDSLSKGYLFIPGDRLRSKIEQAIAMEQGVDLKRCAFSADGIDLELLISRYHAQLVLPLKLQLSGIAINGEKQTIEFNFVNGKSQGENWLGKIACAVAGGFVSRSLNDKISQSSLMIESQIDKKCRRCVLDLGGIEQMQAFKKKIPVLGLNLLDVLSIHIVEHVAGGVRVKGKLF